MHKDIKLLRLTNSSHKSVTTTQRLLLLHQSPSITSICAFRYLKARLEPTVIVNCGLMVVLFGFVFQVVTPVGSQYA
jgi:hypothetical protein